MAMYQDLWRPPGVLRGPCFRSTGLLHKADPLGALVWLVWLVWLCDGRFLVAAHIIKVKLFRLGINSESLVGLFRQRFFPSQAAIKVTHSMRHFVLRYVPVRSSRKSSSSQLEDMHDGFVAN